MNTQPLSLIPPSSLSSEVPALLLPTTFSTTSLSTLCSPKSTSECCDKQHTSAVLRCSSTCINLPSSPTKLLEQTISDHDSEQIYELFKIRAMCKTGNMGTKGDTNIAPITPLPNPSLVSSSPPLTFLALSRTHTPLPHVLQLARTASHYQSTTTSISSSISSSTATILNIEEQHLTLSTHRTEVPDTHHNTSFFSSIACAPIDFNEDGDEDEDGGKDNEDNDNPSQNINHPQQSQQQQHHDIEKILLFAIHNNILIENDIITQSMNQDELNILEKLIFLELFHNNRPSTLPAEGLLSLHESIHNNTTPTNPLLLLKLKEDVFDTNLLQLSITNGKTQVFLYILYKLQQIIDDNKSNGVKYHRIIYNYLNHLDYNSMHLSHHLWHSPNPNDILFYIVHIYHFIKKNQSYHDYYVQLHKNNNDSSNNSGNSLSSTTMPSTTMPSTTIKFSRCIIDMDFVDQQNKVNTLMRALKHPFPLKKHHIPNKYGVNIDNGPLGIIFDRFGQRINHELTYVESINSDYIAAIVCLCRFVQINIFHQDKTQKLVTHHLLLHQFSPHSQQYQSRYGKRNATPHLIEYQPIVDQLLTIYQNNNQNNNKDNNKDIVDSRNYATIIMSIPESHDAIIPIIDNFRTLYYPFPLSSSPPPVINYTTQDQNNFIFVDPQFVSMGDQASTSYNVNSNVWYNHTTYIFESTVAQLLEEFIDLAIDLIILDVDDINLDYTRSNRDNNSNINNDYNKLAKHEQQPP